MRVKPENQLCIKVFRKAIKPFKYNTLEKKKDFLFIYIYKTIGDMIPESGGGKMFADASWETDRSV